MKLPFLFSKERLYFVIKDSTFTEGQENDLKLAINYPLVENQKLIEL